MKVSYLPLSCNLQVRFKNLTYESTFSDDLCMKPQKSLRARAMDILSRQEISRVGLKRKLAPYAESEEELENVLDEFAERNWQSDQRYAEAYIHSKSRYSDRKSVV